MKIHFIGIGGIGISGLAQFMHYQGHQVCGSDVKDTIITKKLRDSGIKINIPHSKDFITDQDLVIHSAIIKEDNVEVIAAKEKGIRVLARREALLEILHENKVYAVAAAHGKSTTTAILSAIMHGSAIIGAESKEFGSNVRYEKETDVLIFEADESDGSFVNSNPYCAIVINAEPEHMEYYKYDYDLFFNTYRKFIESAKVRVLNAEDEFLATLGDIEAVRLYPSQDIKNIEFVLIDGEPHTKFTLKDLGEFSVWGFGEHIAIDASLAIFAAMHSMDIEDIRKNILNFKGIKKRFDVISIDEAAVIIDDYAHHPTEVKATMQSVKEYARLKGFDKITAIWQPHKYSRTIDNLESFVNCFEGCDELVILPVWAAGEALRDIDFEKEFARYNLTMAASLKRDEGKIKLIKEDEIIETLDRGIIVGFGAGDITYQLRGQI
jgi:UDP-N-acetylmuramate--alanine ligase